MAIDYNIPLMPRAVDVGGAFQNALMNVQRLQQMQQSGQQAQQSSQANQLALQQAELKQAVTVAPAIFDAASKGDLNALQSLAANLPQRAQQEMMQMISQGDLGGIATQAKRLADLAPQMGMGGQQGGVYSARSEFLPGGGAQMLSPSGELTILDEAGQPITDPAAMRAFQERSRTLAQTAAQQKSDLEVRTARQKELAKITAQRAQELRTEYSNNARMSASAIPRLESAAKLIEMADQGLTADLKLQAAKIFPQIDVTNEAQLGQAFTQLALDELQKFKGPTTDFEFRVSESIPGRIGDARSANRARIASLRRNNWFISREAQQFREHINSGGDPDSFSFNFGETVKTKRGPIKLADLNDTAIANNMTIEQVISELNK